MRLICVTLTAKLGPIQLHSTPWAERTDGRAEVGAPLSELVAAVRPPSPKASRLYAPARTELEMWTWAARLEGRRRRSGASWGADSLAASSRACSGYPAGSMSFLII